MAMSDTNSNHTDWVQFYQHNLIGQRAATLSHHPHHIAPPMYGQASSVSESTVVTTTSVSPPTMPPSVTGTTTSSHPNIEGRVGKSARKRSRASRRAPTTLLNTDTTNFRAMVQQFTGIPSGPFQSSTYQPGAPTLNFQNGSATQLRQPIAPFELHHQQQQHYYNQYQQPQNQHHQQTMFTVDNTNSSTSDGFLQGFSNTRTSGHDISDGFFTENIFPQVMISRQNSTENRTADGFFL